MARHNQCRQGAVKVVKEGRTGGTAVAGVSTDGRRMWQDSSSRTLDEQREVEDSRARRKEELSVALAVEQIGSRPSREGGWHRRNERKRVVGELYSCCFVLYLSVSLCSNPLDRTSL